MFSALDILYIVLAVILLPIGTLISMILWRTYKMMDRAERIMDFADHIIGYLSSLEKIPLAIIERILHNNQK